MTYHTRRCFLRTSLETGLAASILGTYVAELPAQDAPSSDNVGVKPENGSVPPKDLRELPKTEAEWRKALTLQQFRVLRKKHTERAFTGKYWNSHKQGTYRCAGCGEALFESETKFNSGTGWPSFWQPIDKERIKMQVDRSNRQVRMEVLCARCEGHLGHVFGDGPAPTGLRFCINSASLDLEESATPGTTNDTTSRKTKARY